MRTPTKRKVKDMISLHRLGHQVESFYLNPDLIMTVEGTPDTVITLTTGTKIVVAEPPERVVAYVRECRVDLLAAALRLRDEQDDRDVVRSLRPSLRSIERRPIPGA